MSAEFEEFYQSIKDMIATLREVDPAQGTPEWDLLQDLSRAVEEYEREEFPDRFPGSTGNST